MFLIFYFYCFHHHKCFIIPLYSWRNRDTQTVRYHPPYLIAIKQLRDGPSNQPPWAAGQLCGWLLTEWTLLRVSKDVLRQPLLFREGLPSLGEGFSLSREAKAKRGTHSILPLFPGQYSRYCLNEKVHSVGLRSQCLNKVTHNIEALPWSHLHNVVVPEWDLFRKWIYFSFEITGATSFCKEWIHEGPNAHLSEF